MKLFRNFVHRLLVHTICDLGAEDREVHHDDVLCGFNLVASKGLWSTVVARLPVDDLQKLLTACICLARVLRRSKALRLSRLSLVCESTAAL
jgi:hypothetical protein